MNKEAQAPILTILGPTASGKSALAIRMAKSLGAEILSADSRQCYEGMLIGTSATTLKEQEGIPHHYVQSVSPHASETASSFQKTAMSIICPLSRRHKLVIRHLLLLGAAPSICKPYFFRWNRSRPQSLKTLLHFRKKSNVLDWQVSTKNFKASTLPMLLKWTG
jgi:tRNA A37 N6-isopentenylltransferase MiaA